ncbi:g5759 [Coccomyxa viridis]|uniref:Glutaredoxin-like protein n=1 Tax=Coccomyxa viridis TaxID=1274662 RepID=A0ABP1G097_9CHLO
MLAPMQQLRHGGVCLQRTLSLPSLRRAAARSLDSRRFCSAKEDIQPADTRLYLYSKEGCHLCDGLKEKVDAVLWRAQFMQTPLSGARLEVRDITTKPEWWEAYSLTIPVLTFSKDQGNTEVKVPRPSPRLSADRLEAHIAKSLLQGEEAGASEDAQ